MVDDRNAPGRRRQLGDRIARAERLLKYAPGDHPAMYQLAHARKELQSGILDVAERYIARVELILDGMGSK